ncbi:hypothetical protein EWH99_04125 [Sporolactobacillus sp. THM7-7]|nr:hypothetical protein EWH99_04125 [Sporolactobacillus sp. THM7-7]
METSCYERVAYRLGASAVNQVAADGNRPLSVKVPQPAFFAAAEQGWNREYQHSSLIEAGALLF